MDMLPDLEDNSTSDGLPAEPDVLFDALIDCDSPIEDTILNLNGDDIEPIRDRLRCGGADTQPARRSPWYDARFKLVHDGDDPSTSMTVLQAAFHHVESVHKGSTLAQVDMDIKRALARYGPRCGMPHPANPSCRYPPSYYICKVICDVGDLSESEVHLCPNQHCPYLTSFPQMSRSELLVHSAVCNSRECPRCVCRCGGRRLNVPAPGNSPEPLAPCYFFRDVFQQFFLDRDWYTAASHAQIDRCCNFYNNPEGQRILKVFYDAGVTADQVRTLHTFGACCGPMCPVYARGTWVYCRCGRGRWPVMVWRCGTLSHTAHRCLWCDVRVCPMICCARQGMCAP